MRNYYQTSLYVKSILSLLFALWVAYPSTGQAQTPTPSNGILYVNKNVTGGNGSGNSWANAIPELADALKWARTEHDANNSWLQNDSLQIYVAKGNYKPLYNAKDGNYTTNANRENAFVMVRNVQLYGGFDPANGVTNLTHTRDFSSTSGSILSGDFNDDDVITGSGATLSITNNTENAYHVVISAGNNGSSLIDGFSITGGNASNFNSTYVNLLYVGQRNGGGIYNVSSSTNLTNVTLTRNSAVSNGGGMYNDNGASPILANTTISENIANYGGGMYNRTSTHYLRLTSVILKGNKATHSGGGMYNNGSGPYIINTFISENVATTHYGGGMYNYRSSPVLINATISRNTATLNGNGMYNDFDTSAIIKNSIILDGIYNSGNGSAIINYSLTYGNSDTNNGNIDATGLSDVNIFIDPANGDYSLRGGSIAINTGSNSLYSVPIAVGESIDVNNDTDLAGNPRLHNNTIDMGAFEYQTPNITPNTNNTIYVNKSIIGGTQTGDSWANAIPELADALKWARTQHDTDNNWLQNDSLQIYVAKGTYKPLYSAEDGNYTTDANRDNAFVMVKNVQIYGGFDPANNITDLSHQRYFSDYGSILSGDFNDDDQITGSGATLSFSNNTENAYHVLIAAKNIGNASIDGFMLTGGNADTSTTIQVNNASVSRHKGAGFYNSNASPRLTNLIITENIALLKGGGIYSDNFCSLSLTKATIAKNKAILSGGGMHNDYASSANLTNVIITNNTADNAAGGIYNGFNSKSNLTNVAITANTADKGGAMFNSYASSFTLTNVSIAGNIAPNVNGVYNQNTSLAINNAIVFGVIFNENNSNYTANHSLIEGNSNTNNGNIDATGLSQADIFTDTANGDYSLKNGSLVIDAGDNTAYTNAGGDVNNDTDLANNPRLFGNSIDMGAYENQGATTSNIIYVNKNVNGGNGSGDSWANAIPELADALKWARTQHYVKNNWLQNDSLQIYVAKGTYKPLYNAADVYYTNNANRENAFVMLKNIQLYGGFDPANGITDLTHARDFTTTGSTLSGDFNNDDVVTGSGTTLNITNNTENAYHVLISAGDLGNALIDGFNITGGNANTIDYIHASVNGKEIYQPYGAGIYNSYSSLNFININIAGNSAHKYGGGIFNYKSSPSLTNVTISNNVVTNKGGGMHNDESFPNLTNVRIIGNKSYHGGGMFNYKSSPNLTNVVVTRNKATGKGGGMYAENYSSPLLTNVTLIGNIADNHGDGIFVSTYSLPTINNTIVWGGIVGSSGYAVNHSIVEGDSATINGNIDATGLSETDIFTDPANGDYSLKEESIAINAGNNSLYSNTGRDISNDTDLAGNPRLSDGIIDIGAFEDQAISTTPDANNILYVNKNVTGGNGSGDSWANAIPELADALKWARSQHDANNNWLQNDSLQVYVAKGTYKPLYNADDGNYTTNGNQKSAFVMVKNVQLYGGFDPANGITNLTHTRDFSSTLGSILSGDFNDDDQITRTATSFDLTNNTENSRCVLIAAGDVGNALINGFSITGGTNYQGSTSNNILVNGNTIDELLGGGIHINNASPTLINTNITRNRAAVSGGVHIDNNSSPHLINVTITENIANIGGGVLSDNSSSASLTNVTIAGNKTKQFNFDVLNSSSSLTINNTIVWGGIINNNGNYTANHSLIKDDSNTSNGNIDATGLSETDIFTDLYNGDYSLKDGSPAIDAGDNTAYTNAGGDLNNDTDLAGNTRLFGSTIDIGAFEHQGIKTYWTGN
ncbi:hypothetical protein GGR32_002403, partial [Mesonia hippocampi]